MLETVLIARDRFLKPGGAMYPSHAAIYLAPCSSPILPEHLDEFKARTSHFNMFVEDMKTNYGLEYGSLSSCYADETKFAILQNMICGDLGDFQLQGQAAPLLELDLLQVSLDRVRRLGTETLRCSLRVDKDCLIEGLCGFFEVDFRGSLQNPTSELVTLS